MELAGTEAVQMAPGQDCQHMGQYNTGLPTLGIPTHSSRIREHKHRTYLFDSRYFYCDSSLQIIWLYFSSTMPKC